MEEFLPIGPKSEDDWFALRFEAGQLFSPSAPVDETELFAGRSEQILKLLHTVSERGKHAIIFGERGVGKTSLANTIPTLLLRRMKGREIYAPRQQVDPSDDFNSVWKKTFKDIHVSIRNGNGEDAIPISDLYQEEITPDDVRRELQNFGPNQLPIIVIDEFDKLEDPESHALMANVIKALSDYSVNVTLIIVGVADDVSELIGEHPSIRRCLAEVRMPRMSKEELGEILDKRTQLMGISIEDAAKGKIVSLAKGLPAYVHALGRYSVIRAIEERTFSVTVEHVNKAVLELLEDSEQSAADAYERAVASNQTANLFKHVLLACALSKSDGAGFFVPVSVCRPLGKILGREVEISSFQRHLREFASEQRGCVLDRRGEPRRFRFRFSDPMMQPYVIMRGIREGLLSDTPDMFIPELDIM